MQGQFHRAIPIWIRSRLITALTGTTSLDYVHFSFYWHYYWKQLCSRVGWCLIYRGQVIIHLTWLFLSISSSVPSLPTYCQCYSFYPVLTWSFKTENREDSYPFQEVGYGIILVLWAFIAHRGTVLHFTLGMYSVCEILSFQSTNVL